MSIDWILVIVSLIFLGVYAWLYKKLLTTDWGPKTQDPNDPNKKPRDPDDSFSNGITLFTGLVSGVVARMFQQPPPPGPNTNSANGILDILAAPFEGVGHFFNVLPGKGAWLVGGLYAFVYLATNLWAFVLVISNSADNSTKHVPRLTQNLAIVCLTFFSTTLGIYWAQQFAPPTGNPKIVKLTPNKFARHGDGKLIIEGSDFGDQGSAKINETNAAIYHWKNTEIELHVTKDMTDKVGKLKVTITNKESKSAEAEGTVE